MRIDVFDHNRTNESESCDRRFYKLIMSKAFLYEKVQCTFITESRFNQLYLQKLSCFRMIIWNIEGSVCDI